MSANSTNHASENAASAAAFHCAQTGHTAHKALKPHACGDRCVRAAQQGGFTVDQAFLVGTTAYVVIPSLMVFGTLVLRPGVSRTTNIVLGVLYALTVVAGAIGEWTYYVFGSAIEIALLAGVVYYAWAWPRLDPA